jgi:hypothetical protein
MNRLITATLQALDPIVFISGVAMIAASHLQK